MILLKGSCLILLKDCDSTVVLYHECKVFTKNLTVGGIFVFHTGVLHKMAYAINITGLRAKRFSLRKSKCILFCSLKCERVVCHFIPYDNLTEWTAISYWYYVL